MEPVSTERKVIVENIRRWGGAVAEAILDPSCKIFSEPGVEGLIIYRENNGCAIAVGDPVCPQEARSSLVSAFHHHCDKAKKNIVYMITSKDFAKWMQKYERGSVIEFGEELYLNPQTDPRSKTGTRGSLLRRKVRHAQKEGVSVEEYVGEDSCIEEQINALGKSWQEVRKGPQVYISRIRFFADRIGKRWFYAKKEGKIIGAVVLNHIQSKQGWSMNRVVAAPDAPQGTSELMIVTAIETLAKEGCHFVTFGAIPAEQLGEIAGFSKFAAVIARKIYKISRKLFRLEGRRKYWEKFHPESAPAFLVFKKPRLGVPEMKGLMQALNVSFTK